MQHIDRWRTRLVSIVACAGTAFVGAVVLAAPASAATSPPWHWTQVTGSASLPWFSSQAVSLQCPSGYIPISGGFTASEGGLRLKGEHADMATNQYVFSFGNSTGVTQTASLNAWCVSASEFPAITTATTSASIVSANSRTGLESYCPDPNPYDNNDPYKAIGGDAEWTSGSGHLDFVEPSQGTPAAWVAIGTSPTAGDHLNVTVRCVPFDFYPHFWGSVFSVSAGSHTVSVSCPAGQRAISGGVGAKAANDGWTPDHGYMWASQASPTTWTASVYSVAADTLLVQVLCVPTNVPAVSWTTKPAAVSNAASGQLGLAASDPFGQTVATSCTLDGTARSCSPGTALTYGPLAEGQHTVSVDAVNQDGQHAVASYQWRIDLTPPTVLSTSPGSGAPANTTFIAVFSEQVLGVDQSFTVTSDDDGQPIAGGPLTALISQGCPSLCTRATFIPDGSLQGHHAYTAHLTSGITDLAGNSLTATSWHVDTADGVPSCTDVPAGTTGVNTGLPVALTCADPDAGDALTYAVLAQPSHGTVGAPDGTGGTTYTPDPGYVGPDSFTFRASDAYGGDAAPATATLSVGPNHAPVCQDVSKPIDYESAATVSLDCSDVDAGQQSTFAVDSSPTHGGLGSVQPDGTVTYTPYPGYAGQDSFTYHATDSYGGTSAVRTVTLYVATDAPPTCAAKSVAVPHATKVSIALSCTDVDSGQTLTLSVIDTPAHGSLSAISAGHVTYTPSAAFAGSDSFSYGATDGHGGQSTPVTAALKVNKGETALTFTAKSSTIAAGTTDRLTARLRDVVTGSYLNGQKVVLQSRASTSSAWTTVTTKTTQQVGTSKGTAVFTVTPTHSRYYRVVYNGSSALLMCRSTSLHVKVTA